MPTLKRRIWDGNWPIKFPLCPPAIAGGSERRRIGKIVEALVIDGSDPAVCFNPRHGIRIVCGGETYDFVICLECRVMMVFHNNQNSSISGIGSDDGALNAMLTAAGVPLARN